MGIKTSVQLLPVRGLPLIAPGDNLAEFIVAALTKEGEFLQNNDVVVVAQKVISKSEGQLINLATVEPSARAKEIALVAGKDPRHVEVILRESKEVILVAPGLFVVETHHGYVCANAGVDRSNIAQTADPADEWLCLLPKDADASAAHLQACLKELTGATVAVVINDTHGRPFREGGIGVALGSAGLVALDDQRGQTDLFGYTLKATVMATGDEIAATASLVMGQAAQATPVVIIRGLDYLKVKPENDAGAKPLIRQAAKDRFRYPPESAKWRNLENKS